MFNFRLVCLFLLIFIFTGCEEEEIDFRNTAPTISFSFFKDGKKARLDSVLFIGTDSLRVFKDTLRTYVLPLDYQQGQSSFRFYVQSIESEVHLNYDLVLFDDIDRIKYDAFLQQISYSNIDSLAIICRDTLTCKTNDATIRLFY